LVSHFWSYSRLLEQICHSFQFPSSASVGLSYFDCTCKDFVSIVGDESLADGFAQQMNPLVVKVAHKCSPPFVRVVHGNTCRVISLHQSQREFCCKKLRNRVRKLFKLLPSAYFCFSYKETALKNEPQMIISDNAELKCAITKESSNHLRLNINILQDGKVKRMAHSSGLCTTSYLSLSSEVLSFCSRATRGNFTT
jgi:hypothetical protein